MHAAGIRTPLLDILRAPGSGAELSVDGDGLVSADGRRFEIVEGVPILLAAGHDPATRAIKTAFRERSASYYDANYVAGRNPQREARQALVVELLESTAARGARVLDAGAGPAVLAEPARALGLEYVALDLSLDNLLQGRRRAGGLDAVVGDLTAIPFEDGAFDGALAVGSLEYVRDVGSAVAELVRVVAPDGFVIATFANRRSPRRIWDERLVHPLARVRATLRGRRGAEYRRYLADADTVRDLFGRAGAALRDVRYLNPGLAGYPLSELRLVGELEARVTGRFPRLAERRSELVVVAQKGGAG